MLAVRCSLSWHGAPASYSHRDLHTGHRNTVSIPLHFCPPQPGESPICLPLYSRLCLSLSPFLFYFEYVFVFFPPSSLSGDRERVFYLAEVRKVVYPITNTEPRYPKSKVRAAGITAASSKLWSSWKNWDSQGAFLKLRVQSASSPGCY